MAVNVLNMMRLKYRGRSGYDVKVRGSMATAPVGGYFRRDNRSRVRS